jgi:hypothetical protein
MIRSWNAMICIATISASTAALAEAGAPPAHTYMPPARLVQPAVQTAVVAEPARPKYYPLSQRPRITRTAYPIEAVAERAVPAAANVPGGMSEEAARQIIYLYGSDD